MTAKVEVQTQIELLSDPLERTSACSQTKITGSEQQFERKIVIRGRIERTWVLSEAMSSTLESEQNFFSLFLNE